MMKRFLAAVASLALIVPFALGAGTATLPINVTALSKAALPDGFTGNGLGTDYTSAVKLDSTGDYLEVAFDSTPGKLTLSAGVNNKAATALPDGAEFVIQESSDGAAFSDTASYGAGETLGTIELTLAASTRWVRFLHKTKVSGYNVALMGVAIEAGGPAEFSVAVSPASPTLEEGTELTLTATAQNGVEPYSYEWSGDLGTGSGSSFTVAALVMAGEYEVTVEATDADDATATATVTVVVTAPVAKYAISYAECANGSVSGPSEAAEGESVTVAATPDAGYRLEAVTVDGEAISGTTFSMPGHAVTVGATFEEKPAGGGDDVLTRDDTGVTGTSYSDWSGVEKESGSVYAGNSAGGNSSIQLRSDNSKASSGIVMTQSGGNVTKVAVEWESHSTDGRVLDVYGQLTAYGAVSDLYSEATQGTLLGSIKCGESTELVIEGEYPFIGLRSHNGAMYLSSVTISFGDVPPAEKYEITYAECSNGSVSGPAEAAEGATVSVTATPDAGYRLEAVTVDGEAISGTTFSMPGHAVTVGATFVEKPASSGFEKITSMDDLTEGDYVIVGLGSSDAMKNETAGSTTYLVPSAVTIEEDLVTDADETVIWHLSYDSAAGGWTVYNEAVGQYVAYVGATSKANSAKLADEATELSAWTITYEDGFSLANVAVANNSSNRFLSYNPNSGNARFACYKAFSSSAKKLELYKGEGVAPGPKVTLNPSSSFTVLEGGAATITATAANFSGDVTWGWSGTDGGTWEGNTYTVNTTVPGMFSATATAVCGDESAAATVTFIVKAQPSGDGFTKITSIDELVPGTYVIVGAGSTNAMSATLTSDYFTAVEVEIEDNVVQTDDDLLIWTLDTDGSTWSIASSAGTFAASTVAKKMSLAESDAEDTARWVITCEDGVFVVGNGAVTTNMLQYNSSNPRFTTYNSKQTKLELYLGSSGPAVPTIQGTVAGTAYVGTELEAAFTLKNGTATGWTASLGTIEADGTWSWTPTVADVGTATLTVTAAHDGEGSPATKTFTITVKDPSAFTRYTLVENADDLEDGTYLVVGEGSAGGPHAMKAGLSSGILPAAPVTISDDEDVPYILSDDETLEWAVTYDDESGAVTLFNETDKYIGYDSTKKDNKVWSFETADEAATWYAAQAEALVSLTCAVQDSEGNARRLAYNYNSGNPRFAGYKDSSTGMLNVRFFRKGASGPALSGPSSVEGYVDEELEATFATRNLPEGVTVVGWSAQADGEAVGTIVDGVWTWASPTLGTFTLVVTASLSDSSTLTKNVAVSVTERPQEWAVTVQATGCNALANPTQALAGTQVTVTFEPFQNYEFVSLTVNGVAQTPVGNQVTFTMPNEAVTVVVTCVAQPGSPFLTCEEGTSVGAVVGEELVLHFTLSNATMVEDDDSYLNEKNGTDGEFSEITETTFVYTWTPTEAGMQELDFEVLDEGWDILVDSYSVLVTVTSGEDPTEVEITSIRVKDGTLTIGASGPYDEGALMYSTNLVEWSSTPVSATAPIGFIRIGTVPEE